MGDDAQLAAGVMALCQRRHWSLDAVTQLAGFDGMLHADGRLDALATDVGFLGREMPPERLAAARTVVGVASRIAQAVADAPLPTGTRPTMLLDEALARLAWLTRMFQPVSHEPERALNGLLDAYLDAGIPAECVAQRLEATAAMCRDERGLAGAVACEQTRQLFRYTPRPDVVQTVCALDDWVAALPSDAAVAQPTGVDDLVETVEEFAARMKVSPGTVHQWRRHGLPVWQPAASGVIRINVHDAYAWLRRHGHGQDHVQRPGRSKGRGQRPDDAGGSIRVGGAEFPV